MDVSHLQLIAAIVTATVVAGYSAHQARNASTRVDHQILPNGDGDTRTLRQMITELLHMQNRIVDDLRAHDARGRETREHVVRVERKLDAHLERDAP